MDDRYEDPTQSATDVADCFDCGQPIPAGKVVGCPDGTEICRECFDAGRH